MSYAANGASMTLAGCRGKVGVSGEVRYGCGANREFQYEVPHIVRGGGQKSLPIAGNPTLAELTLPMDATVTRRLDQRLNSLPAMPRIILGFLADRLPVYEDTPGLRRYAADLIGIPLEHLNSNPPDLVEHLFGIWDGAVIEKSVDPSTGLVMVDAELCSKAPPPLSGLQDFHALVGDWTWIPVRELDLPRLPNPAYQILHNYSMNRAPTSSRRFPTSG